MDNPDGRHDVGASPRAEGLLLPARMTRATLVVAVVASVFFECAYFLGWMGDGSAYREVLGNTLHAFELAIILVSSGALLLGFWRTQRATLLLASVALFSWFLGSFFYVSYVSLLERILIYPSVAELAFQGFHLLMIIILYDDLRSRADRVVWPALAVVPIITLMPAAGLLRDKIPLNNLLYSTFFMFLVSLTVFLAINLAVRRRMLILCIGLAIVVLADIAFVETSLLESVFVLSLGPVWFTGFALTALGVIEAVRRGELN